MSRISFTISVPTVVKPFYVFAKLGGGVDGFWIEHGYRDAAQEIKDRRYCDTGGTSQFGSSETVCDDTECHVRITHLDDSEVVLAIYGYEFEQANRITSPIAWT